MARTCNRYNRRAGRRRADTAAVITDRNERRAAPETGEPHGGNIESVLLAGSRADTATVITDRRDCRTTPETVTEELYAGNEEKILLLECCDPEHGYRHFNAARRCEYWPSFAHPRWLTCEEIYNKSEDECGSIPCDGGDA